jgi:hypothetical protein
LASFLVEGDGLRAEVHTNAFGEAEVMWTAPVDVDAARDAGPCADGVAASVRVRPTVDVPALAPRRAPFDLCVPVDRDTGALVRLDKSVRIGDRVHVDVIPAPSSGEAKGAGKTSARGPWSVIARSNSAVSSKSV